MRPAAAPLAVAGLLLSQAAPVHAGEVLAGVFGHDLDVGGTVCCYEHGADLQLGYRTAPIPWLARLGDVRAHAFGSLNTDGGVNFAAAGISYRLHLPHGFYLAPGVGGAVHDGSGLKYQADDQHLYLGSRVLFEPELSLGWAATRRLSVEATYIHLSHGQLAGAQNPGLDDLGVRLAYRFGR